MKPESSPAIGIERLADDYKQNGDGESTGKQGGKLTGMQSLLSASLRLMIIPVVLGFLAFCLLVTIYFSMGHAQEKSTPTSGIRQ